MVATRVTPRPPYSTSVRLLRCIIFSGRESGVGQSETPKHVSVGGSFRRKQPFRPLQMPPQSRQSLALARINAVLIAIGCPYTTGWSLGRNIRIDYRWGVGDADLYRRPAAEFVALAPDVILASGTTAAAAVQRVSCTVPIVFASAIDPAGRGVIANMARPDGNATGFMNYEFGLSVKWLELLKQIAPRVTRVAVLRDQDVGAGTSLLAAIQAVAPSLGVELSPLGVRNPDQIERAVAAFARAPNGGLIVTSGTRRPWPTHAERGPLVRCRAFAHH
jgi:ABC transporter substrate binding protein